MANQGGCSCCIADICEKSLGQEGATAQTTPTFAPDLIAANTSSTTGLPIGAPVSVSIDTLGDHDWYRVSLVSGQTYTFETSSDFLATRVTDTLITLRDSTGATIATNDDAGGSNTYSRITFTATSTGSYFLDAGVFDDAETGTFNLRFAESLTGAGDIISGDATAPGSIAIGGSVNGTINAFGDHDWYAVTMTAGQSLIFRTNSVLGGVVDTTLTAYNSAGVQLAFNDDIETGVNSLSRLRLTAATTGTYYIDVAAFGEAEVGAYNLTAEIPPPLSVFTNDQIADQLINGTTGDGGRHYNVTPGGVLTVNITALTTGGQFLAREALNLWTDVTGISFSEITGSAQLRFDDAEAGAFASTVFSDAGIPLSSNINVGTEWLTTYGTTLNSYSLQTYIHEIGHALGLGHGGDYNGSASYGADALYLNDSWATTIMSYFNQRNNLYFKDQGFTTQFAVSPIVADGIAVANLYGVNTLTRTGDTVYGYGNTSGRAIYDATLNPNVTYTVFDNGGIDTLNYSESSAAQTINLNAEAFSSTLGRVGNVTIARGSVIENANGGSGADTLIGNAVNNVLNGGAGSDNLNGGVGVDTISYGTGQGAVFADLAGRYVVETGLQLGTVLATTAVLSSDVIVDFENFEGSAFGDRAYGTDTDNIISANAGDDYVYAEGGNDSVIGGIGSDILLGGSGVDTISYAGNAGAVFADLSGFTIETALQTGTVNAGTAFSSFDLLAQFENLTGSEYGDRLYGDAEINFILGGGGDDIIYGGAGNDILSGGDGFDRIIGEVGADSLTGGAGADQFFITGALNSGIDTITDFVAGSDSLRLLNSVFGLVSGSAVQLVVDGAAAAAGTFIYNTATGALSFDGDGAGGLAAIDFANIGAGSGLTATDLVIYG
jgi:serralysin